MIYDEGFELEHENVKYFSFSKYSKDKNSYKSLCGQTLVGWYNNLKTGERGCFRGVKYGKE
jgi:cathepsin C